MRTWKMEGPPEMVAGMVMWVITSCSLRPASRARKPPIAWMPSCELPAMRMMASETRETREGAGWGVAGARVGSLMANREMRAPGEFFGGLRGEALELVVGDANSGEIF